MEGTTLERAVRLIAYLGQNPTMLPRYVKTSLYTGTPVTLCLPWISFSAIDFLKTWLKESMSVFEWGAGGSTIFFSRKTKSVMSIENDSAWYQQVSNALSTNQCTNVDLRLIPFTVGDAKTFRDSEYLHSVQESEWDIILIDGTLGYGSGGQYGSHRVECFTLAEQCVRPGGIIVVDDIWMFPNLRKESRAYSYQEFKSVGPCRVGVTSTGVFFY